MRPLTFPTLTAATGFVIGDWRIRFSRMAKRTASQRAMYAPVTLAVRVPPSAWSTSQSMRIEFAPRRSRLTTPRSDRPMRRWISCVRPSIFPRFRRLRVSVEPGSMSYSAVTQPVPLPFFHGGTPASKQAVHRTTVLPVRTSTDPGALCVYPRINSTGRRSAARLPSLLAKVRFSHKRELYPQTPTKTLDVRVGPVNGRPPQVPQGNDATLRRWPSR